MLGIAQVALPGDNLTIATAVAQDATIGPARWNLLYWAKQNAISTHWLVIGLAAMDVDGKDGAPAPAFPEAALVRLGESLMLSAFYNVRKFAMIPMGAPFFMIMGTCVMLGAFFPESRTSLVNGGFAVGGMSFAVSWKLAKGLDNPTRFQIFSLVCAIVLEFYVVIHFDPWLQSRGERIYLLSILAIVAAHFLVMAPAYGMAAISLTVLCGTNAAVGFALPDEPLAAVWFTDGLLKALIGATMLLASPVLQGRTTSPAR